MAKIKFTKNELKSQKDALKRFTRYLPTLELKKKQLLVEIQNIQKEIERLQAENERVEREVQQWAAVYADEAVDPSDYIKIKELRTGTGNIAGIDIPVFEDLTFEEIEYDYFTTPLWIDAGIRVAKEQMRRMAEWEVSEQQRKLIEAELRTTIQRIKLFEEVKIPEAKENIRVIQIFLGDQMTAEVVRGKIAKKKIERKKTGVAA
ncbi:V-type ATP synthase subunit D [candidate division KSB1 bacterium]|nr:V-type ATP synthase subunit D [candidate division KSB1 bacterium]